MISHVFKYASVGLVVAGFCMVSPAHAGSVKGVAVGSTSSSTQVGSANAQGVIDYYIPLSGANSGVYGVTAVAGGIAGTFSDGGTGYGYNDPTADALQMYLRYDLSSLDTPAATATLNFRFDDLDLTPYNDPNKFFEDVQFNYYDGTSLVNLTHTLLDVSGSVALVDLGATVMVDAADHNRVRIVFPGLASIINSLPSGSDAFYVRLDFSSFYDGGDVWNTPEYLLSSVLTTTAVPVPAAAWMGMAMLGGLGIVGKIRRKRHAA